MATDTRLGIDRIVTNEQEDPDVLEWVVAQWESPHTGNIVSIELPAEWFPEEIEEGDSIVLGSAVDEGETERQRQEVQDLMDKLMDRDNSPPE